MFYQVRILGPKGTVGKIISSEELSKIHWNSFQASNGKNNFDGSEKNGFLNKIFEAKTIKA
jgi:hypothetical protein